MRLFAAIRVFGALAFVTGDHGVELADLDLLLPAVVAGIAAGLAAVIGPHARRAAFFQVALGVDILVLAVIVNLTGGLTSPFLPLVAVWTPLVVIAHSTTGALVWVACLVVAVFGFSVGTRLLELDVEPTVGGGRTLLATSLLTIAAAGVVAEHAALRLDAARQQLEDLSLRDPLTGLWNRRAFDDRLTAAVNRAQRGATSVLAIIDLDAFKQVNDTHGHAAGDLALQHLAGTLLRATRIEDECFRLGGDEFAVLMMNTSLDDARSALTRVRSLLESSPTAAGPVTISSGLQVISAGTTSSAGLEGADRALYRAKAAGRNVDHSSDSATSHCRIIPRPVDRYVRGLT